MHYFATNTGLSSAMIRPRNVSINGVEDPYDQEESDGNDAEQW
ncbi:hypothetical protein ACT7DH_14700 [Bacillus pacificus]